MNPDREGTVGDELTEDALARRVYHLNTLYELSQEISTLRNIEEVLKASLLYIIGVFGLRRGVAVVYQGDDRLPSLSVHRGIRKNSVAKWAERFSDFLGSPHLDEIFLDSEGSDPELSRVLRDFDLCIWLPLRIDKDKHGGMILGKKLSDSCFTVHDLELLSTIGTNIQNVLSNASLIEALNQAVVRETRIRNIFQRYAPESIIEEVLNPSNTEMLLDNSKEYRLMFDQMIASLEEQHFMEQELALAKQVQEHLLPGIAPEIPGIDISAVSIPARGVCGDFYDFIPISSGEVLLSLADISGKGLSAAMIATMLQSATRMCIGNYYPIPAVLSILNRFMFRHTEEERYSTIFYGIVDSDRKTFTYSNAGHPAAILLRDGEPELLEAGGPMVGLFEHCSYEQETLELQSGDALMIYSDGVTDAGISLESEGVEDAFGYERLESTFIDNAHLSADELVNSISDEVTRHIGMNKQFDDITLIVMKVR